MLRIFPAQAKDFISILSFYCLIVPANVDFQGFHNSKSISQRHQHCRSFANGGIKSSDADIKNQASQIMSSNVTCMLTYLMGNTQCTRTAKISAQELLLLTAVRNNQL